MRSILESYNLLIKKIITTMNENIDLTKILKNCSEGTKLYSTVFGDVTFCYIDKNTKYPIILIAEGGCHCSVSANGKHYVDYNGECTLFPSKDQRDWSKFTASWYKKERFNPNTLNPFDKVLVRISNLWRVNFFSNKEDDAYRCIDYSFKYCIPYNDDTKYLVGTTDEPSDYYCYWKN